MWRPRETTPSPTLPRREGGSSPLPPCGGGLGKGVRGPVGAARGDRHHAVLLGEPARQSAAVNAPGIQEAEVGAPCSRRVEARPVAEGDARPRRALLKPGAI